MHLHATASDVRRWMGVALTLIIVVATRATGGGVCDWITNPANGHCYRVSSVWVWGVSDSTPGGTVPDWWDAEAEAQFFGGHLVTINDAAENQWLVNTFGTGPRWIGLTDWGSEGTFYWISGEPVTYTNWDGGQPDDAPPRPAAGDLPPDHSHDRIPVIRITIDQCA